MGLRVLRILLYEIAFGFVMVAQTTTTPPKPVIPVPPIVPETYRLGRGDVIDLRFFFNPELNETAQIRPDGRITLQLVGAEVEVANKTIVEATKLIESAFAKELKTPRVSIQVRSFTNQRVLVSGEVNKPGVQPLVGDITLFAALTEAGGIRLTGKKDNIILIRKGPDAKPVSYDVRIREQGKLTAQAFTPLAPFDVILVPETKIAKVDRWVDQFLRQTNPANLAVGFQYLYSIAPLSSVPF